MQNNNLRVTSSQEDKKTLVAIQVIYKTLLSSSQCFCLLCQLEEYDIPQKIDAIGSTLVSVVELRRNWERQDGFVPRSRSVTNMRGVR